jgi:4-hydroxy-tetrahydrodipicolinate reductase
MIRVGVIGHAGRMGAETCRAIDDDGELELVARIGSDDDIDGLTIARTEVAVDFTTPDSVKDNVLWCLGHGIRAVVGTTGLGSDDLDDLAAAAEAGGTAVFVAPNFALGAVLMMRFAAQASAYYDTAEIVERHHAKKAEAPSGTALRTASLMNEARVDKWTVAPSRELVTGARGGDADGVHIHSVRLPGSVAHQEVVFGGVGETLTIRHDSLDRSSFMPGVVLAIKKVRGLDGLVVGLENLLDL